MISRERIILHLRRSRSGVGPSLAEQVRRLPTWTLALGFALPLVVAIVYRLATGYWWWRDFDAVLCAGAKVLHGSSAYGAGACPGLHPAEFVYPPQVAWLAARVVAALGAADLRLGFLVVQLAACAFLAWLMLGRRLQHVGVRARLPALGLVAGGVVACGNVAIICHALVAASLLGFRRTRAPFIAAVVLITLIKPVYATYLVVLLLEKVDWRTRLARGAAGALAVAALGVAIWTSGGPELGAWHEALRRIVVHGIAPGGGLLGLFARAGLPTEGPIALAAFAVFAALMSLAGLAIAEARGGAFAADERWLFGLGLAQLINPRPMGYDFVVLAPAIGLTCVAAQSLGPAFAARVRGWMLAVCLGAWAMALMFMGGQAAVLVPSGLALGVLAVGAALAWRRLQARTSTVPASAVELAPVADGAPALSLVICTLDEHEAIGGVLDEVGRVLADLPHEIIVVDDSADERTGDVVRACAASRPEVRLIRRSGQSGLAGAAIAGWDAARGRVLGLMDGDGQHDPASLRAIWERLSRDRPDVVLASRYARGRDGTGLTGVRDRISRIGTWITHLVLGVRVTDPLSGLFLMRRSWYEHVRPRLSGVGFKILLDVIASGARAPRTAEAPTRLRERAGGVSKLDVRVMADLAGLLVEKATRGLISARLALFLAVGVCGVGVHMACLGAGRLAGAPFWAAQGMAIVVAMTSNFFMNNALTFRQARLTGAAAMRGLGVFYASCLLGGVLNEALASEVRAAGAPWTAAALSGLLAGALCNYFLASRLTWRSGPAAAGRRAAPWPLGLAPARAQAWRELDKSL